MSVNPTLQIRNLLNRVVPGSRVTYSVACCCDKGCANEFLAAEVETGLLDIESMLYHEEQFQEYAATSIGKDVQPHVEYYFK